MVKIALFGNHFHRVHVDFGAKYVLNKGVIISARRDLVVGKFLETVNCEVFRETEA